MKSLQLLLIFFCLLGKTTISIGQSLPDAQTANNLKIFITTVYKLRGEPGEPSIKGCLYSINDSLLTLVSPYGLKQDLQAGKPLNLMVTPLSAIEHVSVTRRGKAGKGLLIGFGLGSLVGLIASSGEGSSNSLNFTFTQGAMPVVLFGGLGMLLGAIIGVAPNAVVYRVSEKENWKTLDKYAIETQLKKPSRGTTVIYEPQRAD